ncbi:MAG: hypothetical protein Q4F79_12285 [Eubacteriales bacterium]|nr:hypothetical protein [Eubacteriales bacterium]
MTIDETKEYITIVYEMEKAVFEQQTLLDLLQNQRDHLPLPVTVPDCSTRDAEDDLLRRYRRYQRSLPLARVLNAEIPAVRARLQQSKAVLSHFYAADVIDPRYRNFVAVCSLCAYLTSGRCETLEGQQGAYALYEQEAQMGRIVTELDAAIQTLYHPHPNQSRLYHAILKANQTVDRLYHSIERAARFPSFRPEPRRRSARLSAYDARCVRKEDAYKKRMAFLCHG